MVPKAISLTLVNYSKENLQRELLQSWEVQWRDRQRFLETKGYLLRPRLRPGWTPSWVTTGKTPLQSEDGHFIPV